MILEAENVTKNFGGLVAVNKINLAVEEGMIHCIIGPNGAGKTTLFNILTGELPATSGQVFFKGKKITGLPPHQIARLRIGRSFQQAQLFRNLTVLENVRLAAQAHHRGHFNILRHFRYFAHPIEEAISVLGELHIMDLATQKAGELSHGQQRILEVAMALADNPVLLLLDEPTSGMSPNESVKMIGLLRKLGQRITLLIIEHNMNLVMSVSSVITVLHQGVIIASGAPDEIARDSQVRSAYLGRSTR